MKNLALIISLIISLAILTGCKQEEQEAVDANEPQQEQVEAENSAAEQTEEETPVLEAPADQQETEAPAEEEVSEKIEEAFKQQQPARQEAPKEAEAPEFNPDEPVAVVYGETITEGDIMEKIEPQLEAIGKQIPPQYKEAYVNQMRAQVQNALIVEKLLERKTKDINVPQEEVDETFKQMVEQSGISMEAYKDMIQQKGFTVEEVKADIEKGLTYQKFFDQELGDKVDVTEADANEFYEQNIQQFKEPAQVKAAHILIKTDPNTDPNDAKQRAEEILEMANKPDANFAELAKEYSEGPSAPGGGDLGWFGRGQMVKPFEEAAFAMDPNSVSDLVKTDFGFHIIKVYDKKEARTVPFAEAKVDIIQNLKQQKQGQLGRAYIQELMQEAQASGNLEILKPVEPPQPMRRPQQQPAPQPKKAPAEEETPADTEPNQAG